MTQEDIRATITEMCRVQPSLLLHILDHCNGQPRLHPRANHLGVPAPIVGKCQQSKRECAATEQNASQNCNSRLPAIFASQGFLIRTASQKNPWPSELSKSRVCLRHVMSQLIYSLTNENVHTSSDLFTTMAASMDIEMIKNKI